MEIWQPIPGYEGLYSASNFGNIRSEDRTVKHYTGGPKRLTGSLCKPYTTMHGYLMLTLCKENIRKKKSVHRLVLSAFIGEKDRSFDACHIDGNRTNNKIENLRWDTRKGNMQDVINSGKTNKGVKNPNAKLSDEDVRSIKLDERKQKEIAAQYGVNQSAISYIKTGQYWRHI